MLYISDCGKVRAKDVARTAIFLYICKVNYRSNIAAFTGHRTYDNSSEDALWSTVVRLYDEGIRHFRCGMAEGFDLAAAEATLRLKGLHADVVLECVVPWSGFVKRFGPADNRRYHHIIDHADTVRYTAERYHLGIYHRRNDMLVEGAGVVVAWWNGSRSGTEYTVRRAQKQGAAIINLHPSNEPTLQL